MTKYDGVTKHAATSARSNQAVSMITMLDSQLSILRRSGPFSPLITRDAEFRAESQFLLYIYLFVITFRREQVEGSF